MLASFPGSPRGFPGEPGNEARDVQIIGGPPGFFTPRPQSFCGQGKKSHESGLLKSLAGILVFGHPVYAIEKRVNFASEEESDRTYTTTTRSQIHVRD